LIQREENAGRAIAIEHAAHSNRPSRRFALILSATQPPASRPMAPTAPTEIAETLLACLSPISWKRCRKRRLKGIDGIHVELWKMPDRMIHHIVGSLSTASVRRLHRGLGGGG